MRKITYLLCFFILTGCAKKSDNILATKPTNTAITYSFAANVSGTYSLTYISPLTLADSTIQFTGTTWSRNYTISNASAYTNGKTLPLFLTSTAEQAGQVLTLKITVNDQTKVTATSTSTNPAVTANYAFTN